MVPFTNNREPLNIIQLREKAIISFINRDNVGRNGCIYRDTSILDKKFNAAQGSQF
jgi:hypothetical protein